MDVTDELPMMARLEVVRVQPGDVLVLACEQHLTEADVDRIRDRFNQAGLDGLHTLVLDGGMHHLDVIRHEGGQ